MKFKLSLFNKFLIGTFSSLILIALITGLVVKPVTMLELTNPEADCLPSEVASFELTQPCEGINYFSSITFNCTDGRKYQQTGCESIENSYQQAKNTCQNCPSPSTPVSPPPADCLELCQNAQNRFKCIINCISTNP